MRDNLFSRQSIHRRGRVCVYLYDAERTSYRLRRVRCSLERQYFVSLALTVVMEARQQNRRAIIAAVL